VALVLVLVALFLGVFFGGSSEDEEDEEEFSSLGSSLDSSDWLLDVSFFAFFLDSLLSFFLSLLFFVTVGSRAFICTIHNGSL